MKTLELIRGTYGALEFLAPGAAERVLVGCAPDARGRTFIRVLGARHLLQAAATIPGGPATHRIGAGIDALHALTMLVLATVDRRRRHASVANALIALAFATAEIRSGTVSP